MIFNVMHRNGSTIAFDIEKIMAAVEKALQSSSHNDFFTQEEHQNYHSYTLSCSIYKDTSSPCPRYMARIRGNIVDKLWKRESIWIEGIRPYPATALTFCETFENNCEIAVSDDCDD